MSIFQPQPDAQTGFIHSTARNSFSAEDKLKFIEMAQSYVDKEEYPDINFICRKLGFNIRTFWRHYDADDVFKEAFENIEEQIENVLNRNLISNAKKANGVGAAAFWLKNRISKRWSDNPGNLQINVDMSSLKKVLGVNQGFIDADIVDNKPITSTPLEINTNQLTKVADTEPPSENK